MVVVVAGWGGVGVDGYSKLPNGDGSNRINPNSLRRAVYDWMNTNTKSGIVAQYGPIEEWDVSDVTSMKYVFYEFGSFNADLSKWETGKVTNMQGSKCTPLGVVFFPKQE